MARIVRPVAYGSPDVLRVVDVATPDPGPGEVLVRVRAAGVNPIDWKLYSGAFHRVDDRHSDAAGVEADSLPRIGLECAGVVDAVGAGVDARTVGDEVIVYPVTAAYADYVVVPTSSLTAKPSGMGWPEAGALMLAGTTASHALHAADVRHGETVLVHGGSGGVGLMAVQLAVGLGATVVATAAVANHGLLRRLGAVPVTYGPGLLDRVRAAAPDGVDAALDLVGTDEALDTSLALVAGPGRIASITGGPRRALEGARVLGNAPGADIGTEVREAARPALAAHVRSGNLTVIVAATYPLESATEAHRAGLTGHAPGKLVLVP
jgi:NADPH:quinone reductase-like Zn-dependent oxidoreductase